MALVHDLREVQYSNFIRGGMDFAAWYRMHDPSEAAVLAQNQPQPGLVSQQQQQQTKKPQMVQGLRKTAELARAPAIPRAPSQLQQQQQGPTHQARPPHHLPSLHPMSSPVRVPSSRASGLRRVPSLPSDSAGVAGVTSRPTASGGGAEPSVVVPAPGARGGGGTTTTTTASSSSSSAAGVGRRESAPLRALQALAEERRNTTTGVLPGPSSSSIAYPPHKEPVTERCSRKADLWRRRKGLGSGGVVLDEIDRLLQPDRAAEAVILRKAGWGSSSSPSP